MPVATDSSLHFYYFAVGPTTADMPPGTDCPYPIRILAFFEMITL